MPDSGAGSDTANAPVKRPADYNKQQAIALGVPSESCCAEMLGLNRFSAMPRLFRTESKGPAERLLNPFGDPWSERKRHHRHLSIMTSSCRALLSNRAPEVADKLGLRGDASDPELARYAQFLGDAQSPYHYDETVSHLSLKMPEFAKLKALYNKLGEPPR